MQNPETENLPTHIAIIMDGNGRWAAKRHMPRTFGHKAGAEATRKTVRAAGELGLKYLTLFAFSSENWTRPEAEIGDLMGLLKTYLKSETAELTKNNVRLRVIGRRDRLSADIVELIEQVENTSRDNTGLQLTIALDYGGRDDIVNAVERLVAEGVTVTEDAISARLYTHDLPEPDLLIRTSGEMRISNFLLWQCAYAEFYFTDVLWPEFDGEHLKRAIADYSTRQRRFGGVVASQISGI